MESEIINKVANSGIITLDAEEWLIDIEFKTFDIKPLLYQGLILREKDFRASINDFDFSIYKDSVVAVHCSEPDAIIQHWAWMLITTHLVQHNATPIACNPTEIKKNYILYRLNQLNADDFTDARVVIKGCGAISLPPNYYNELTRKLIPKAKAIMFGEPCSTVPVYKNRVKKHL
jgi:hypothetical protein